MGNKHGNKQMQYNSTGSQIQMCYKLRRNTEAACIFLEAIKKGFTEYKSMRYKVLQRHRERKEHS